MGAHTAQRLDASAGTVSVRKAVVRRSASSWRCSVGRVADLRNQLRRYGTRDGLGDGPHLTPGPKLVVRALEDEDRAADRRQVALECSSRGNRREPVCRSMPGIHALRAVAVVAPRPARAGGSCVARSARRECPRASPRRRTIALFGHNCRYDVRPSRRREQSEMEPPSLCPNSTAWARAHASSTRMSTSASSSRYTGLQGSGPNGDEPPYYHAGRRRGRCNQAPWRAAPEIAPRSNAASESSRNTTVGRLEAAGSASATICTRSAWSPSGKSKIWGCRARERWLATRRESALQLNPGSSSAAPARW